MLYPVPISTHIIMANIMIMGDSWARGEWSGGETPGGHGVTHAGTEQYLREAGHRVSSVALGGSSNRAQVDRARVYTENRRRRQGIDHIIWFLTDPCRDIAEAHIARALPGYLAQRDHLLRQQFDRVRHLPILLIGGVSAVPAWVAGEYPLFTCLVRDLRCWLMPHAEPCEVLCRGWPYPSADPDLLDHFEQQEQQAEQHLSRARHETHSAEHRWFWPDGHHPNRAAHQLLTEELILPLLSRRR